MHKLIVLGVLPAIALASPAFPFRRTDYEAKSCAELGLKQCGTGCIQLDYTCCPAETGGCPPGNHCVLGDDKQPGCCLDDYVCTGNGGVVSTTFSLTSTAAVSETVAPEATTTTTEADVSSTSEEPVASTTETAASTTEGAASTTAVEAQSSTSADAAQSSTTEAASATETSTSAASTSATVSDTASTGTTASDTTTNPSTTAFTTSTVYTTTTKTITSCPASHPCHSGTGLPPVTVITETIAVSTTICPVVESPPLPLPTTTTTTTTPATPHSTTILIPIAAPTVHCPGHGSACHSVVTIGTSTTTVKAVPIVPATTTTTTTTSVPAATRSATGTGAYRTATPSASATGRVVTAGAAGHGPHAAARAGMGMAAGVVGVVVFDLLQHAGFQF